MWRKSTWRRGENSAKAAAAKPGISLAYRKRAKSEDCLLAGARQLRWRQRKSWHQLAGAGGST